MANCPNCASRYFKTLETRGYVSPSSDTASGPPVIMLLWKKRCKRCKFKTLFAKELPGGPLRETTHALWLAAKRVTLPARWQGGGFKMHVGEYSRRVSAPADRTLSYLQHLNPLQEIHPPYDHPTQEKTGPHPHSA